MGHEQEIRLVAVRLEDSRKIRNAKRFLNSIVLDEQNLHSFPPRLGRACPARRARFRNKAAGRPLKSTVMIGRLGNARRLAPRDSTLSTIARRRAKEGKIAM
jgi:hypothetical protein